MNEMTSLQKAQEIYYDCFIRWSTELSHDKNVLQAKAISLYVCEHVLSYMGADRGTEFWENVKDHLEVLSHRELYVR
jgi:hypothetical protein